MTAALIAIASLTAVVSTSLIVFTSLLERTSLTLSGALESLRIAQDAERELLLHERTEDSVARDELGRELQRDLLEAETVGEVTERPLLERAEAATSRYLAAEHGSPEAAKLHAAAHAALESLAHAKLVRARQAEHDAQRWTSLAKGVGVSVSMLVVIAAASMVWWIQRRALRPLFGLSRAMRAFARGDAARPAEEDGPEEIRVMAEQFNEMAGAIERQRQRHRTFIAAAAHDMRTPLSALRFSADIVAGGSSVPSESRLRVIFGVVRRQVVNLERLVRDLLDTSSLEAGHLDLQIVRTDVRDVARAVVTLFQDSSAGHEVELSAPPAPVCADCDAVRVEQVLTNLVSNAIKYSPRGGLVSVAVERRGEDVVLRVSDEGIGMTADEVDAAFEPFERSGRVKGDVPGHGLGLFLVKRIVDAHHGSVSVESAPGHGTSVTIRLPASPVAEGSEPALAQDERVAVRH
jgi:signal transduction histidine kinase